MSKCVIDTLALSSSDFGHFQNHVSAIWGTWTLCGQNPARALSSEPESDAEAADFIGKASASSVHSEWSLLCCRGTLAICYDYSKESLSVSVSVCLGGRGIP